MRNFKVGKTWGVLGKQQTYYGPTHFMGEKVPLNNNPLNAWDYKKSNYRRIDGRPADAQQGGVVPQDTPTPTPTPAPQTPGNFNYIITQINNDILISGTGQINLSSLSILESGPSFGVYGLVPNYALIYCGDSTIPFDGWVSTSTYTSPGNFGTGSGTYNNGYTNLNGEIMSINDAGQPEIVLPQGYVSGTILTSASVLQNSTFNDVGLTEGTYTWTFGEGDSMNTITAQVIQDTITGYTAYSQTLTVALANTSVEFVCNGNVIQAEIGTGTTNSTQEVVDYFNTEPLFSAYGTWFNAGNDIVGLEMSWNLAQSICPFGELTLNIFEHIPIMTSLYRAFNPSAFDTAIVEYLDPESTPVSLTTYPESLYDFCAIVDSPQVVEGDVDLYYYSECNIPPAELACACSQWGVLNTDLFAYPSRTFTYIDCDGVTQSVTLAQGDNIQVCGCASSFIEEGGTNYLNMYNQTYDICPLGDIGFDDRDITIYGNYIVRSLSTTTTTTFNYINYIGDTINVTLQPQAIIELTGVKVGSLKSQTLSWMVTYQGEYIPS